MIAGVSWFWWPAGLLLIPLYLYAQIFVIFVPSPQWERLEELKNGSARWTPCSGKTQWLDQDWEVREGSGVWHAVKIPSDLATLSGFDRTRVLEFRTRFSLDNTGAGRRFFLGFLGAGGRVSVFLDGRPVVRDLYALIPFEREIGDWITQAGSSEHELRVRVNRRGLRAIREMALGPGFASGIFRDVYIQSRARVYIDQIRLTSDGNKPGPRLCVHINGNESNPIAVSGALVDAEGKTVFQFQKFAPGVAGAAELSVPCPQGVVGRWSRFKPLMYKARATLVCGEITDTLECDAGYKTLDTAAREIRINGKSERLFGVRRAEHFPPYGAAFPGWAMKRDAALAKDTQLNLLMNVHYPMHPAFLDTCDQEGVYVAQDLPAGDVLRGDIALGLERLEEIMRRAEAHPCFLFWYLDRPGLRVAGAQKKLIAQFIRSAIERGRLMLSPRAAAAFGIESNGPELTEATVDVYQKWEWAGVFGASESRQSQICILDMVDGRGGADTRHAREMRKAYLDQKVLKAADTARAAGVVLGHMFGWGLRMGLMSVTRKKKVSMDVVRDFLRTRTTGGVNVTPAPSRWFAMTPPLALAAILVMLILVQPASVFLTTCPMLAGAFIPPYILMCIKETTFLIFALSISFAMEKEPGYMFRLAPYLRFPIFLRLCSRWYVRALAVGVCLAWFQGLGWWLMGLAGQGESDALFSAVALASIPDVLLALLLFADCSVGLFLAGAALVQGVVLSAMIPALPAVVFVCAAYGLPALFFACLRRGRYFA